jgi:hypothetical protein
MDTPVRLCVDKFLPNHLLKSAGRIASKERPEDSVCLRPENLIGTTKEIRSIEDESSIIFQKMGVLRSAKWERGRTINIGFYDDAPRGIPSTVMSILEEGTQYGNLNWRQVPVNTAEYRVSFIKGKGLWSYIGNQSLSIIQGATCNLGDTNWNDPRDIRRVVIHEIWGHGSGCLHAQSLPSYSQIIDLDEEAIIRYYMSSQGWSYEQAKQQWVKVSQAEIESSLRETRTSIMAYEVNKQFDRRRIGIPFNWEWDEEDKKQYGVVYGTGQVVKPPPPAVDDDIEFTHTKWVSGINNRYQFTLKPGNYILKIKDISPQANIIIDVGPINENPTRIPVAIQENSFTAAFSISKKGTYITTVTLTQLPQDGKMNIGIFPL